jgi:hypothetical protein
MALMMPCSHCGYSTFPACSTFVTDDLAEDHNDGCGPLSATGLALRANIIEGHTSIWVVDQVHVESLEAIPT